MKKFQINQRVARTFFEIGDENIIKQMMTRELGNQLADTFFNDLQLKRNSNDMITAIDYSYNFAIVGARQYNNILHKLETLINYIQNKKSDDQLLYYAVDLKNEILDEKPVV